MKITVTHSPDKTEAFAEAFARKLKKGAVVALSGPLGSGKTTFVKGLARGLKVKESVKSPTFNLLHIYKGKIPVYHFDFYRLEETDLENLGFNEYVYGSDGVAVLEWAERVKNELPQGTYWVSFSYTDPTTRKIRCVKK